MAGPLEVRATDRGFFNNSYVEPGDILVIPEGDEPGTYPAFSKRWMVPTDLSCFTADGLIGLILARDPKAGDLSDLDRPELIQKLAELTEIRV